MAKKYIDADLLRKEIEYLKVVHIGHAAITKETNAVDGLDAVLQVIDSLQQEEEWEGQSTWIEQPSEGYDIDKHIDEIFEMQGYGAICNTRERLTIKEEAKLYSLNIESRILNSLPQELQEEWRKEIESAYIIGASAFRVSSDDLEEEMDRFFEEMPVQEQENIFEDTYQMIARHFYELGKNSK